MTTITVTPAVRLSVTARRRVARAATVLGTAVAATLVLILARSFAGEIALAPQGSGGAGAEAFTAVQIFGASCQLGLLGWATLALCERFLGRAHRIWTTLGVTVLALSMVPIWLYDATAATRTSLVVIHLVVAAGLLRLPRTGR